MNTSQHLASDQRGKSHDDMTSVMDDRTYEIIERRRSRLGVRRRGWLVRRALVSADVLGLTLAFFTTLWLFGGDSSMAAADRIDPRVEALLFLCTLPGWVIAAKLYGLYDRDEERTDHSTADDFGGVFHMVTVCVGLLFLGAWITNLADPELDKILAFWVLAVLLVCTARVAARAYCRRQVEYLQNTVIVGAGDVGQLIAKKYLQHPEYGINLVGFIDAEPKARREDLGHLTLLGEYSDLPSLIRTLDVERVLIAFSRDRYEETLKLIRTLKDLDVQVDVVPRLYEIVGPGVKLHTVEGVPLIGLPPPRLPRSSRWLKRVIDIAVSAGGLLLVAPLGGIVALAIKLESPGPVFYKHRRVGRDGRPIDVFKFRSMRREACRGDKYGGDAAETTFADLMADPVSQGEFAMSYKLQDDPRVTRVGRLLRKTSLDELPQLINSLRGDLSLVGPRPLVADEIALYYGDDARRLLTVTPGITGYWQINGRSALTYQDRVWLDLAYISNWSLGLDLMILAKTLRVLFSRRGAV